MTEEELRGSMPPDIESELDVARLERATPEEVVAELKERGIQVSRAIKVVSQLVEEGRAEVRKREGHHGARDEVTDGSPTVHSSPAASDAHALALESGFFLPVIDALALVGVTWETTHTVADLLWTMRCDDRLLEDRRLVLQAGFEHLAAAAKVAEATTIREIDAAWPISETLEEIAAEVVEQRDLWDDFALAYADLSMRSPVVVKCILVHALKEIFDRGNDSRILVATTTSAILTLDHSSEVRVLIAHFKNRHSAFGPALPELLKAPIGEENYKKMIEIETTRHEALETFASLHAAMKEHEYFESKPVQKLLESLKSDVPTSFLAMYALADVYHCAGGFVAQDSEARREGEERVFTGEMLDRLRDASASHFVTVETFERLRDQYPQFAASFMADLSRSVDSKARQALFVCLVEGYEQSFQGVKQAAVPQFDLRGGHPRFVAGRPHELDLYGEKVCASEIAEEMRSQMEWANRRLRRWLFSRSTSAA